MKNTTTYTQEFANRIWIPFWDGTIRNCICNFSSVFEDLIAGDDAWKTADGGRFDLEHMKKIWGVVVAQKRRVFAHFIAEQRNIAFNPAYELASKVI